MLNEFSRTERLIGSSAVDHLKKSHVAVFGIGGVGGYAAECLARSGIGKIDLVDNDTVSITNINRQLIALHSTIGKAKVDVMKERIHDINPECIVRTFNLFFSSETKNEFDFSQYDYVIDCIDTVSAKLLLIECAKSAGCRIICSMGTGNKLNPMQFEVADISKTSVCPLARVMRTECRKRGLNDIKVVYSKETPRAALSDECASNECEMKGSSPSPASIAFVPGAAGLLLAGQVIKELAQLESAK